MTRNRKRGRNNHEEEKEFMPLSKRINNLHINGSLLVGDVNVNLQNEWAQSQVSTAASPTEEQRCTSDFNVSVEVNDRQSLCYCPELNEVQNPHYFNTNKLLFEMYVERMHRTGVKIIYN